MKLPPIEKYEIKPSVWVEVVRCDLIEGGFKRLAIDAVYTKTPANTLVFASNSLGSGSLALVSSLKDAGKKVIIFLSTSDSVSPNLQACEQMGAVLDFSGAAPLNDSDGLRKEALAKYNAPDFEVLPIGLENEEVRSNIIRIAKEIFLNNPPTNVWVATASGMTIRGLETALPMTQFHAVPVKGNNPDVGRATIHLPAESFREVAQVIPPYPSNRNYDAKVWEVLLEWSKEHEIEKGTVIFNIA